MKKMKIKGNDYVMVHERVMEFHRLYPNGSIKTEIVEMTNERFTTVTTATPDVAVPERFFTGIASESITDDNSLEVCETSSCGRCLGFLNIGIDTSIASFEEVDNAIEKQKNKPTPKSNKNGFNMIDLAEKVLTPAKTNLKDREVPNPLEQDVIDNLKGIPVDGGDEWDGSEIIRFGKYRDVIWSKVQDDGWIKWVAEKSKVDWQQDLAKQEVKRRGI